MTSNTLQIKKGNRFDDERGVITYNNDFDASEIKRIYTIENCSTDFIRGWQGHKIERRWFACINGEFEISVIKVDNFDKPADDLQSSRFRLNDEELNYLLVPAGCITAIKANKKNSKLLVLADFALGVNQDEYRFPLDYFKEK